MRQDWKQLWLAGPKGWEASAHQLEALCLGRADRHSCTPRAATFDF